MSDATFRPAGVWPSDAPLVSTLFARPDGTSALHRRLHPRFEKDSLAVEAFRQEIRFAERLGAAPQLATVWSSALEPSPWIAREWSRTGTLAERIRREPHLSGRQILGVLGTLLAALEAIETGGATHGDPSPRNLLLRPDGTVALADGWSSRRSFAVGKLAFAAGESIADDHRIAARWLAEVVRRATAAGGDPLAEELAASLRSVGTGELLRVALERFVALHRGEEAPVDFPSSPERQRRGGGPVPTVVSVEPVADPRVRYRLAKRLALVTPFDAALIRKQLESEPLVVESVFPEPARSLAGAVAEEGGKAAIRCRVSEVAPAKESGDELAGAPSGEAGMPVESVFGPAPLRPAFTEAEELPPEGFSRLAAIVFRILNPLRPLRELVETLGVLYLDSDDVDRPWIAKRAAKALGGLALRLAFLHAVILALVVVLGGKAGR